MSKNDTLDRIENYLDSVGICSARAAEYASIGFRLDELPPDAWREIVKDVMKFAPPDVWVYQDHAVLTITHIDDVQFPISIDKKLYEENLRSSS